MEISLKELLQTECQITDITAVFVADLSNVIDYSKNGRFKNLLYYCIKGPREYYDENNKYLFSLAEKEVLFISDKTKYVTKKIESSDQIQGICLCFNVKDQFGEIVKITDSFSKVEDDSSSFYFNKINRVYLNVLRNQDTIMGVKSAIMDILNSLFSTQRKSEDFKELLPAVSYMEKNPENNASMKELASMCCISESSFFHKFLKYSGGISPQKYRNRIRIMRAEEMANDGNFTIEGIAEALGFYDASHLCRCYKKFTGRTLKGKQWLSLKHAKPFVYKTWHILQRKGLQGTLKLW